MKNTVNAEAGSLAQGSLIERIRTSQRRRLFDAFSAFRGAQPYDTVLNVCISPSPLFDSTNCLWEWSSSQERSRIITYEIAAPKHAAPRPYRHPDAIDLSREPNELHLPFADASFDWVFCNEVIERMGTLERQYALLKELSRISRKGVFLGTSNRWHPFEFNTALPFLHWLPDAWWRRVLRWTGKNAWAAEHSFQLVDSTTLYRLASLLPGKPKNDVGHKRILGVKAHFFLMVEKCAASASERKSA
ncbi:methyltransferase domain-containing protein [Noviherbaspirillum galbum]|uniref:Class I SAM-dependent methyltransferase n=1 Tax=Noviherbaspirillum galbum TaxID=2709383 RepID=A0A6B3SKG4_9BURK|nr:methyltransferase domain-containing protein [Noviherbaspirillum galbum]NEX59835.1 class I SAM-dependent methyltransferase [Noviherbaspirillum galbum]